MVVKPGVVVYMIPGIPLIPGGGTDQGTRGESRISVVPGVHGVPGGWGQGRWERSLWGS